MFSLAMKTFPAIATQTACHFVGSRFANIPSICADGFCKGILLEVSEGAIGLTCDEAVITMRDYLTAHRSEAGEVEPIVPQAIRRFINREFLPFVEELASGTNASSHEFWNSAAVFDRACLITASRNWTQWETDITPPVVRFVEWSRLRSAFEKIAIETIHSSYLDTVWRETIKNITVLYFDFVSLLGGHFLSEPVTSLFGRIAVYASPIHRPRDSRVFLTRKRSGIPLKWEDMETLSKSIDRLGSVKDGNKASVSDILRLKGLFEGWDELSGSSTQALISHQIITSICSNLPNMFVEFRQMPNSLDLVRLGVSLIDFCRDHIPRYFLVHSRWALSYSFHDRVEGVGPRNVLNDISVLYNGSYSWGLGLLGPDTDLQTKENIASGLLRVMIARRFHKSSMGDAATLVALGRAIGLAVLYGADVSRLQIPEAVVRFLHPRSRPFTDLRKRENWGYIWFSRQSLSHLANGIAEVLNPGGFHLFSNEQWMYTFMHGHIPLDC